MSEEIQVVTPTIDVDDFTEFPQGFKMTFEIKGFKVYAEVTEEGEETEYSAIIEGIYNDKLVGREPNAEDAQAFLYKTILDGIFVDDNFTVVAR